MWALAAPDADDIANLDIKVVIDCIDNVGHEDGTYDLLDSRLADPTYVYTLGVVNQKDETCKLTIFAAEYVKAYGEEENIQARHKLADENVWYQTIELKWVDGKWTADTTKVTFNVTGDKEYDPNEPAVVNYTVNYFYDGEQNKDASYTGWGACRRCGESIHRQVQRRLYSGQGNRRSPDPCRGWREHHQRVLRHRQVERRDRRSHHRRQHPRLQAGADCVHDRR